MLISTKGRYALRVLVDMAEHASEGYIPLKEIAQRQEISEKYLESIVKELVKRGVLAGVRGKGGGYRLCRPPEQINVGDILNYMEGTLAPVACPENGPGVRVPDAGFLARAGRGDPQLHRRLQPRQSHAHRRAGKRLYHIGTRRDTGDTGRL